MNDDVECGDQNNLDYETLQSPKDEHFGEIRSGTLGDVLEGGKDPRQIPTAGEMQYVDAGHNHDADWDGNQDGVAWVLAYHHNQRSGDLICDVEEEVVDHPQSNLIQSVGHVNGDVNDGEIDGAFLGRQGHRYQTIC